MTDPTPAFDTAASSFTALGEHLWDPIGRHLVSCAGPQQGERVLDACCGDGASVIPAARAVGAHGLVDAVDLSPAMVGRVTDRCRDLPQVVPHQADVSTWPGEAYDVVQCALGIFFFPDVVAGTEHLVSRSRPGGRVAITIWQRGAVEDVMPHLIDARERVTGERPPGRPASPIDEVNVADAFGAWVSERGLREVQVTVLPLVLTMTPTVAWLLVTGSGYAGFLHGLTPDQVEAFRRAYLDSLAQAGLHELDATTLTAVGVRG